MPSGSTWRAGAAGDGIVGSASAYWYTLDGMWRRVGIGLLLTECLAGCSTGGSAAGRSSPLAPTKHGMTSCPSAPIQYGGLPAAARSAGIPANLPWISTRSKEITGSIFYYHSPVFSHRIKHAVIGTGGRAGGGAATKILWWAQGDGSRRLTVTGHRLDAAGSFRQTISGPLASRSTYFPSIITVPTTGCWSIELQAGSAAGSVTIRAVTART
jgi:hypothetical protein